MLLCQDIDSDRSSKRQVFAINRWAHAGEEIWHEIQFIDRLRWNGAIELWKSQSAQSRVRSVVQYVSGEVCERSARKWSTETFMFGIKSKA